MSTVQVVHCIDTEGPLFESMDATFERLETIFGLKLEPSEENLRKLQEGEFSLDVDEETVQAVVDPHLLNYNETWSQLDDKLDEALSLRFRSQFCDSNGNPWIYNWFLVDHVDYDVNPRRRAIGYHQIFDKYRRKLIQTGSISDGIHFHHHPHPFNKHAHQIATHWWANSDALYQTLSRRIIDRQWFPAANRPGFHTTRPDSHWFLEQFIPFDYANQAKNSGEKLNDQFDLASGRFGDWRRAPKTWEPYHPSHDDYQTRGECRRWIARCLNIGTRHRLLNIDDVRHAFEEAEEGKAVILSFTNHDFRDIRPDVAEAHELITSVASEFPEVDFEYSEAVEAMRKSLGLEEQEPCDLEVRLERANHRAHTLHVRTEVPTFGPQPYLAFKTVTGDYHHDNFDFQEPNHEWTYVFDHNSFRLRAVDSIGVAANNAFGTTTVSLLDVETGEVEKTYWNRPE